MIKSSSRKTLELILKESRLAFPALDREDLLHRAATLMPSLKASVNLQLPVRSICRLGETIESVHGILARCFFARAVVAHLALKQITLTEREQVELPASVLALYPTVYERLAAYLGSQADVNYWVGDDSFLKDLRMAGGYSVPCGAQDVDLVGTISKGSGLKALVKWGEFRKGWTICRLGGPIWFNIHTDQRYTEDFNEEGWNRCYLRIAAMLVLHPSCKGMVGTSWFYDPNIVTVSPRLGYLQVNPTNNGAFLIPHGPGSIHTTRATKTSASRKKLYDEGKYIPVCYSLVWPRSAMIAWAEKNYHLMFD